MSTERTRLGPRVSSSPLRRLYKRSAVRKIKHLRNSQEQLSSCRPIIISNFVDSDVR